MAAEILIVSAKYSPILGQPEKAADAHRKFKEFYPKAATMKDLRERAESDPVKAIDSGVLLIRRTLLRREIPVDAFGEIPETIFLFRDHAEDYGQWLKEQGILSVPQSVVGEDYARDTIHDYTRNTIRGPENRMRPFCNDLRVYGLSDGRRSELYGRRHLLGLSAAYRMQGIRELPTKHAST